MTIFELLVAIRKSYVEILACASTKLDSYVEPAYRLSDGSLATEGLLDLPFRADIISKEDTSAGQSISVDSETQLEFEAISFDLGTAIVTLSPFVWDWVPLEVRGFDPNAASGIFKSWFLKWFNIEDSNDPTPEGLSGVVHFMSEPELTAESSKVTIDLGSSPVSALEDLLLCLSEAGATRVHIG